MRAFHKRHFDYGRSYEFETCAIVEGREVEPVDCEYEISPEEPDVNFSGEVTIIRAVYRGVSILNSIDDWNELQGRAEGDASDRVRAFYEDCE